MTLEGMDFYGFVYPATAQSYAAEIRQLYWSTFCHHSVAVVAGILISPRLRSARIAEFA